MTGNWYITKLLSLVYITQDYEYWIVYDKVIKLKSQNSLLISRLETKPINRLQRIKYNPDQYLNKYLTASTP